MDDFGDLEDLFNFSYCTPASRHQQPGNSNIMHFPWAADKLREAARSINEGRTKLHVFAASSEERARQHETQHQQQQQAAADAEDNDSERQVQLRCLNDSMQAVTFRIPGLNLDCLLASTGSALFAINHPLRAKFDMAPEHRLQPVARTMQLLGQRACQKYLEPRQSLLVRDCHEDGSGDARSVAQLAAELLSHGDTGCSASDSVMLLEEPYCMLLSQTLEVAVLIADISGAAGTENGSGKVSAKLYVPPAWRITQEQLLCGVVELNLSTAACLVFTPGHFDLMLLQQGGCFLVDVDSSKFKVGEEQEHALVLGGTICGME